jgi:hypothetical protein
MRCGGSCELGGGSCELWRLMWDLAAHVRFGSSCEMWRLIWDVAAHVSGGRLMWDVAAHGGWLLLKWAVVDHAICGCLCKMWRFLCDMTDNLDGVTPLTAHARCSGSYEIWWIIVRFGGSCHVRWRGSLSCGGFCEMWWSCEKLLEICWLFDRKPQNLTRHP